MDLNDLIIMPGVLYLIQYKQNGTHYNHSKLKTSMPFFVHVLMQQIYSGYKMCICMSSEMAENKQHCCLARSSLSDCLSMTDVFISFGLAGNIQCS